MPWLCESCGGEHVAAVDQCRYCGYDSLTEVAEENLAENEYSTEQRWQCGTCGRLHPKNRTLCSECGSGPLSQTAVRFYDVETARGRLAAVRPYIPGLVAIAVVLVLAVVAIGGLVPDLLGPEIPEAPGDGESAHGLDLTVVEDELIDQLGDKQTDAGSPTLTATSGPIDSVATHHTRNMVRHESYGYTPGGTSFGQLVDDWDVECGTIGAFIWHHPASEPVPNSEAELAELIISESRDAQAYHETWDTAAAEVHAAEDGGLYATVTFCR